MTPCLKPGAWNNDGNVCFSTDKSGGLYPFLFRSETVARHFTPTFSIGLATATSKVGKQPCLSQKEFQCSLFPRYNISFALHTQLDRTLVFALT